MTQTRKEKLLELAERCENYTGRTFPLSDKLHDTFVELGFKGAFGDYAGSLDAVSTLEKEFLPDEYEREISFLCGDWFSYINFGSKHESKCVDAYAKIEPLARLAALLKALAEME